MFIELQRIGRPQTNTTTKSLSEKLTTAWTGNCTQTGTMNFPFLDGVPLNLVMQ